MMTATSGIIAVTGASRGIGAAVALELARRGFTAACLSRSGERPALPAADAALAERLPAFRCDVTDEQSVRAAFAAVASTGQRFRGLVNNAGFHVQGRSDRFATADFEKLMATNSTAVFVGAREAFPHLVAAGGGLIVNMGSFFDKIGVARNVAYCASKAAVGAITRCLAVEWASKGIQVLDVAPGYILTDLNRDELAPGTPLAAFLEKRIPGGRPAPPEVVARLVAALFCESIPFLTGETIYLDGGQGMAL
jgi:NAD(P)-dependent dehydrogenase (short-subunit alcohol dehydrogenase family)